MNGLSDAAVVTLDQLRRGAVEAGDLVSKCGRNELLKLGLCHYQNGKWGLTEWGGHFASRMAFDVSWQGRPAVLN